MVPEDFIGNDYYEDNYPLLIFGNKAFDNFTHKEEFPYFIEVQIPYEKDVQNGLLPIEGELDKINRFEEYLEKELSENVKLYYIYRQTYKGEVKIIFAFNKKEELESKILEVQKEGLRKFNFEINLDKNWDTYKLMRSKIER